uniref:Sulfotransferase domain-containing protein n=1 Tax=uncultured Nocardioidaceae bacterium TaxID=253824 RepID=A0A6J4LE36_9ACTN|nr:MAG: hypothetical protein AVDCRST_MAG46-1361 [uncultured Nocardioidaceae bacterium]
MRHPVYLHIGPAKTGTTYLQQLLWENRDRMRKQGILRPGEVRDHHYLAAADLTEVPPPGLTRKEIAGRWASLVGMILAHDGPAVVSHERFCSATRGQARRAVADLGERDVHIIFTARNARALHESRYQQTLKSGRTWTFEDFTQSVLGSGQASEKGIGLGGQAMEHWGAVVPAERFHVVTMPGPGASRTLLWERFAQVIGFDLKHAVMETGRVNESIGVVEAELLRQLNAGDGDAWPLEAQLYVKHRMVPNLLAGRPGQRKISVTDPATLEALVRQTEKLASTVRERGFHVVGDLAELEAAQAAMPTSSQGGDASTEEVLELALESLRWCAARVGEVDDERKRLSRRVQQLDQGPSLLRRSLRSAARRTRLLPRARQLRDRVVGGR